LSTVDSEFGRTTDPVRMYMREMGSVELLTREGEVGIAKRIEDGLRHMIQAICACPTTIAEILVLAERIEKDEIGVEELIDPLLDSNVQARPPAKTPERANPEEKRDSGEDDENEEAAVLQTAAMLKLKEDTLQHLRRVRSRYHAMTRAL